MEMKKSVTNVSATMNAEKLKDAEKTRIIDSERYRTPRFALLPLSHFDTIDPNMFATMRNDC